MIKRLRRWWRRLDKDVRQIEDTEVRGHWEDNHGAYWPQGEP